MPLRFTTLDVFTDKPYTGNPLAVLCDQPELSTERMQAIAQEFNLSETVFIVPARDPRALRRLRIFTPVSELPFAGHPTIGAAHTLVTAGIAKISGEQGTFTLELGVGLVPINVTRRKDAAPFIQLTTARLPESQGTAPSAQALARMLGLQERDIVTEGERAQAWSCGLPYLIVPVRDRAALARARPNLSAWPEELKDFWARHVYAFCREPELPGSQLRARMFAPEVGVIEDPATGSAAAGFAGYLAACEPAAAGTRRWVVEQGFEMGRPSILTIEVDFAGGNVTAVRVGGTAVLVSEGTLLNV